VIRFGVFAGLFVFAALYDQVVGWLDRHHYGEAFVALEVVFGVSVTLIGVCVIDPAAARLTFWAFVASGIPMLLGHTWRYARARSHIQDAVKEGLGDAAQSETLAE